VLSICRPIWQASRLLTQYSKIAQCRDPNDNHLLALALDGAALFLVTGDQDLLGGPADVQVWQRSGATRLPGPAPR
jgi:putative PIN family toxin of toxin-antitoxin system